MDQDKKVYFTSSMTETMGLIHDRHMIEALSNAHLEQKNDPEISAFPLLERENLESRKNVGDGKYKQTLFTISGTRFSGDSVVTDVAPRQVPASKFITRTSGRIVINCYVEKEMILHCMSLLKAWHIPPLKRHEKEKPRGTQETLLD
ncbi:hypothetical protein TNCV_4913211 [Trichonephila clavipes]|nr:hypothetical protein TNCV_4913211 [Trichonephila clavipes]